MTGDDVVALWVEWTERKEQIMYEFFPLPSNQRLGQFLMNELYMVCPTIERLITGSFADPFNDNAKIPDFFKQVDDAFIRWERLCHLLSE